MDPSHILIVVCLFVLGFHLLDLLAHRLRIPSVVLLLAAGIAAKPIAASFSAGIVLPDGVLQGLGAVGLALIVLEGSMGLKWKRESRKTFSRATLSTFLGITFFLFMAAPAFRWIFDLSWKTAILHALPLSVISSAIAIPSAARLSRGSREFIAVESSLSDIVGILLFNAVVLPGALGLGTLVSMGWRSMAVFLASVLLIAGLMRMLRHSIHHVRFVPLLAILLLFYAIGKLAHLPSLLLVFLFGISLANLGRLSGGLRETFVRPEFELDAILLKTLVAESAFLARTFFFFLFGFSMNLSDLARPLPWALGAGLLAAIFIGRAITLSLAWEGPSRQILSIAPRGLITVLLMGMIPEHRLVAEIATGPVLVVILGSTLAQLFGGRESTQSAGTSHPGTSPSDFTKNS